MERVNGPLATSLDIHGFTEHELDQVVRVVYMDMLSSLHKHGRPTSDPTRGISNCTEELGEAASEAVEATRPSRGDKTDTASLRLMVDELSQLAAYTMLLIMSMKQLALEVERGK